MFSLQNLIKITLIYILFEQPLVMGVLKCVMDAAGDCTFTNVFTNETHPLFHPTSFEDPSNVSSVAVCHSKVPLMTNELCRAFPNLRTIEMEKVHLKQIQDEALSFCINLSELDITHNNLTEVKPNLFINNPAITKIDFSSNQLTYVDVKVFEPIKNLKYLNLGDNFLVHLDFRAMPLLLSLKRLWIQGNNLLDVDEFAVIQKLPNLKEIAFNDNLFDCRNLKLMIETFKKVNLNVTYVAPIRKTSYTSQVEQEMHCLSRGEHLKATADHT